jgi:hypothetical protein
VRRLTISVDFDGVLHSYSSGWQGARNIPDEPVPGAMQWLLELLDDERFEVCIYSSRSHALGGISAMHAWLQHHMGPRVRELQFPSRKPPAHVSVDDRGWRFDGEFPGPDALVAFKPWWKK